MSKLQRRSDGAVETQDGLFAVKIRVISGKKDKTNWFEFKPTVMSAVTRIEWAADSPFALLPQDEARMLVRAGYAIGITDEDMDAYNEAIGEGDKPAPKAKAKTAKAPEPPPPEPVWAQPPKESTPDPAPQLAQAKPDSIVTNPPVAAQPLKPIVTPTATNPLKPIEPPK